FRASASRRASEAKITQVKAGGFGPAQSFKTVPAQPISRSSQCAPRQSTCRRREASPTKDTLRNPDSRVALPPDLPGHVAAGVHVVERLLVLEGVQTRPEALVPVGDQLLLADQALERLLHEFFAVLEKVEDLALEDEEPAVDPQVRIADV